MQDRPTAVELLDALATYLEEEVGPELEGPLVYRTRVAMNLLTVVRRELSDEEAVLRACGEDKSGVGAGARRIILCAGLTRPPARL